MRRFSLAAAVASLLAVVAGIAAGDSAGDIVLTITSSASDTVFSAHCTLTNDGDQVTEDHSGTAPVTLRFKVDRLRCELSSDGPLEIVAEGPRGNRTRTATSGGRVTLTL